MTSKKQRSDKDRRKNSTPLFSRYTLSGRRMKARREKEEEENYYVDRYEYKYLILIVAIVTLSISDAYFTLNLLQGGGIELNPFMAILISVNSNLFLVIKIFLTAGCVLFFLSHKNFRVFGRLRIVNMMYTVFILYVVLIVYEVYLILTYL